MAVSISNDRVVMTAAADEYSKGAPFKIRGIHWYGASNGHSLVVHNESSEVVFSWAAVTGRIECFEVFPGEGTEVKSFHINTLGGGTVVFFLG